LGLDTGQGVFRLDPGFAALEGVRLQQYNRSPQAAPFPGEQNANFIEIAIPLAALGLAGGPHTIQVAAVVGGAEYDTSPQRPWRALDRSHLGLSWNGAGMAPAELEGVPVDLGPDLDQDGDELVADEEQRLGTNPNSADTDQDGLSDGFEVKCGLDPLGADGENGAEGDPDRDGLTNLQEMIAGTHPRDWASALRLGVERTGPGTLLLVWEAVPGRNYRLETASALGADFVPAPGFESPRPARSAREHHLDSHVSGPGAEARLYRLSVWPQNP